MLSMLSSCLWGAINLLQIANSGRQSVVFLNRGKDW